MSSRIALATEVQAFLDKMQSLINNDLTVRINNKSWANKCNKTQAFMAETGLKLKDIKEILQELQICNYSYTDIDYNQSFANEELWIFGITKNIIDMEEDLYIKLKIRGSFIEVVQIMSFHREQPSKPEDKLKFPYKK